MIDTDRLKYTLVNHKFRALLFPKEVTYINFKTTKQSFTILLSKERVEHIEDWSGEPHVVISGDTVVIEEILLGKIKLLDAKKLCSITIEGSYRHQLMLETILWFNQSFVLKK
ncbi:hypothetical protein [Pallidibacillus pasinlerensis]|uniref:SCP2 domain-containing protein n=1 Tax=Pallidibacillus pasinlerensis TaxID=2703818 RepID=A0ABX0A678_9BACI|nr:hypothetical protein [Pallidibacillus pasinlerensis]NCU16900.1 hypothetical protein [Pallidibacillus pasinlerensis]